MSIEETNKLRISLGMAPLETDDGPKVSKSFTIMASRIDSCLFGLIACIVLYVGQLFVQAVEDDDDEPVPEGVNVILEDGIKIHHKTADNLGEKKKERELKEKLEVRIGLLLTLN